MEGALSDESSGRSPGRGRLEGRRVLVVGAGQQSYGVEDPPIGNGRAISALCAREGAAVAAADIDADLAGETALLVEKEGGRCVTVVADAADDADSKRMVAEAATGLGGLDGLVLNLGIAAPGGLETTAEDWDRVLAVNLRSHFLASRHALAVMQGGGSIVLISSIASTIPIPGMPSYTASKAALSGLVLSLAAEGARRGVRANVVAPGLIDTPLGRLSAQLNPDRSSIRIPLRRQGTAWEVAYATVFLLSDESTYVTAQELAVDGGVSRLPPRVS